MSSSTERTETLQDPAPSQDKVDVHASQTVDLEPEDIATQAGLSELIVH